MVLIGGTVYMFGGEGNSGETGGEGAESIVLLNELWSFIESNEWKEINLGGAIPKARKNHGAVAYGEKMFVFFGVDNTGAPLGDIWAYARGAHEWQVVQTLGERPGARSNFSVSEAGGKVYLFGGEDQYGNVLSDLWSLDLRKYTWNQEPECDVASQGHRTVTNGTEMYVYGGDNGELVYDHLLSYDFAARKWQKITPQSTIPPARTCHIATLDANKIRVSGGRGQTEELRDTWEYDIVSNQWVKKADGPVQSRAAAVVRPSGTSESMISASLPAANHILMFGGERGGQFLDEMWKYSYESNAPKITPAINLLLLNQNP
jgi:N-acetylneuraminic acid mutarotase